MRNATLLRLALLSLVVGLVGCFSRFDTRLPTFTGRPPEVERRAMTVHDPLPERDLGPDTQVRPRGFNDQRSEPRRSVGGRGMMNGQGVPIPPTASDYPNVVPQ
jgi:hypothetical protein